MPRYPHPIVQRDSCQQVPDNTHNATPVPLRPPDAMARLATHRFLAVFVLLSAALIADASLLSTTRRLLIDCYRDDCGVYCGPPRDCNRGGSYGHGGGYPGNGGGYPGNGGGYPGNGGDYPGNGGDYSGNDDGYAPPVEPEPQPGCVGGLPFGLENCLCDGAQVGEAAGLAACSLVAQECLDNSFAAFSFQEDKTVDAIQQVCDTFAKTGCSSAADNAKRINPGCGQIIDFGTNKCTPDQAKFIFDQNVDRQCAPLCPECVTRQEQFGK